jgi:CRP/FNR family transcriptional regulator, cyclic AMP receptor protein
MMQNKEQAKGSSMLLSIDERRQLLRKVKLFEGIDEECLTILADELREVAFETGAYIAREGEMGTGFYLIVRGGASVEHKGKELAHQGPGDYFGELSLLNHRPRVASVIATEPTLCLALASWELDDLIKREPKIAVTLLKEAGRRLAELQSERG